MHTIRTCALDHDVAQCTPECPPRVPAVLDENPFAQLTPNADRPDHRTPVQKRLDQARTDSLGFPRGFRTF